MNGTNGVLEPLNSLIFIELNKLEKYWIAKLKPPYNISSGGEGGDTITLNPNKEKILQKIRKAAKNRKPIWKKD